MRKLTYILAGFAAALCLAVPVAASGSSQACETRQSLWSRIKSGNITGSCQSTSNEQVVQARTTPALTQQPQQSRLYVALGDSVAAGLGLVESDQSNGSTMSVCGVSLQAYPAHVAQSLGKPYVNAACKGATAGDLVTKQRVRGPDIDRQLDTAFAGGVPDVITITAGANDVRWVGFARKCYITECGTRFDTAATRGLLTTLRVKLEFALESINRRSAEQPPVVVLTGYYQPISVACTTESTTVTADEVAWFSNRVENLNMTIENSAAAYDFARFAPVDFTGHELCTPNPWVQDRDAAAPFHPTAQGQQVIAESVIRQLR